MGTLMKIVFDYKIDGRIFYGPSVIIVYCHARLQGQLWDHRWQRQFLPLVGQYLSNRRDCWEKINTHCYPTIQHSHFSLLGICLGEFSLSTQIQAHIALFIIMKTWKQLRCPSVHERIIKLWYVQTMECYQTMKMHEGPLNVYY